MFPYRVACGIIARSAGLFENAKRFCACDGVTIWDERDKPVAGEGRQSKNTSIPVSAQLWDKIILVGLCKRDVIPGPVN